MLFLVLARIETSLAKLRATKQIVCNPAGDAVRDGQTDWTDHG